MALFIRVHHASVDSALVVCAAVLACFTLSSGICTAETYEQKLESTVAKRDERMKDLRRTFITWRNTRQSTKVKLQMLADKRDKNHRKWNGIKVVSTGTSLASTALSVGTLMAGFFTGGVTWALAPVTFMSAAGGALRVYADRSDNTEEKELLNQAKITLEQDKRDSDNLREHLSKFIEYVDKDYCHQIYKLKSYQAKNMKWYDHAFDLAGILSDVYDFVKSHFEGGGMIKKTTEMAADQSIERAIQKKDTLLATLAYLGIDVSKIPSNLGSGIAAKTYFQSLGTVGKSWHVGLLLWNMYLPSSDISDLSNLLTDINNNVETEVSKAVREQVHALVYPNEKDFDNFLDAFVGGKCPLA